VSLREWATEILSDVLSVAEVIDRHEANESYADSVRLMLKVVNNVDETPSARMLADLEETQSSFFEYTLALAKRHSDYFGTISPLDETRRAAFEKEVADSLLRQHDTESADDISLDQYLQKYFSAC